MAQTESLFHITTAGREAHRRAESRLPEDYRAVLAAIEGVVAFEAVAAVLPCRSREDLVGLLEDLEAIGLIESLPLEWLVELHLLARYEPQAQRAKSS